jgi:hypothetical protein
MERPNDPFPIAHFFAHMMSTPQSIRFVRERCRLLEQRYSHAQETLLREANQAMPLLYGQLAAYDLASWSIQRLWNAALDVRRYTDDEETHEKALCFVIETLTREIAFLGHVSLFVNDGALDDVPWRSPGDSDLIPYHQALKPLLKDVLQELAYLLEPLLINLVIGHMGLEQVHALDTVPYRSDLRRREAVATACQQLADENKLDRTYAALADELAKISFPRDIHGEEDRYRRHALPMHVNRLLVADLLAFIATIRGECFPITSASDQVLFGCSGAAQQLLDRRATACPLPERTMWIDLLYPSQQRLKQAGILAQHEEPCPFCRTHCTIRRVTFPEGTDFGEASQSERDQQREHSYSFYPKVPVALPESFVVSLDYSGIWNPDRPWTLLVFDANEGLTSSKEKPLT